MRTTMILTIVLFLLFLNVTAGAEPLRPSLAEAIARINERPAGVVLPPRMPAPMTRASALAQDSPAREESFWKTPWPYVIIGAAVAIGVAVALGGYDDDSGQADGIY